MPDGLPASQRRGVRRNHSLVQESKQLQSIAGAAEAEAKEGELTRHVMRCVTRWAHAPLWGEARQRLLRKEMAAVRGLLYVLPALARGLLSV